MLHIAQLLGLIAILAGAAIAAATWWPAVVAHRALLAEIAPFVVRFAAVSFVVYLWLRFGVGGILIRLGVACWSFGHAWDAAMVPLRAGVRREALRAARRFRRSLALYRERSMREVRAS
jgi:hypothetical protein